MIYAKTETEVELKVGRNRFAKMAIIAQSRQLDMHEVMKHELVHSSWLLATCDGMLRKTNKATICKDLEGSGIRAFDTELSSACVIDAMNFVQKLDSNPRVNILAKIAYFFTPPRPRISYFFPDLPDFFFLQIHKNLTEMVRSTNIFKILVLKMTKKHRNGTTKGK